MVASPGHVLLAQALIGHLTTHKNACEAYLRTFSAHFPRATVTAVTELMAQFGTDEVSSLAQELSAAAPGEERWDVQRMIDLIDRVQGSLSALVESRRMSPEH